MGKIILCLHSPLCPWVPVIQCLDAGGPEPGPHVSLCVCIEMGDADMPPSKVSVHASDSTVPSGCWTLALHTFSHRDRTTAIPVPQMRKQHSRTGAPSRSNPLPVLPPPLRADCGVLSWSSRALRTCLLVSKTAADMNPSLGCPVSAGCRRF